MKKNRAASSLISGDSLSPPSPSRHHADDGAGQCRLCKRTINRSPPILVWPCPAGCGNPIDAAEKKKRMIHAARRPRRA